MAHTKVTVERLPKCDFCEKIARYDGRTKNGQWAYMCEGCFAICGVGLGLGKGQELILAHFDIDKALDEISYKPKGEL